MNNGFVNKVKVTSLSLKFPTGQIVATPGVMTLAEEGVDLLHYLARHVHGDWGDLDIEDIATNNENLRAGNRLHSSYDLDNGKTLWIITERDRSVTTLLLPEEY